MISPFAPQRAWLKTQLARLRRGCGDDRGATTLEYVIIAAIVCAAAVIVAALIVTAINTFGSQIPMG